MMINGNMLGDDGKHSHIGMNPSGSFLVISDNVGRGIDPSKLLRKEN